MAAEALEDPEFKAAVDMTFRHIDRVRQCHRGAPQPRRSAFRSLSLWHTRARWRTRVPRCWSPHRDRVSPPQAKAGTISFDAFLVWWRRKDEEDEDGEGLSDEMLANAQAQFAEHDSEKALFAALDAADAVIAPAMAAEDFSTAMTAMANLRGPIDDFFTNVQVNADVSLVRRNRLNLLSRIRTICLSVADLTLIEG